METFPPSCAKAHRHIRGGHIHPHISPCGALYSTTLDFLLLRGMVQAVCPVDIGRTILRRRCSCTAAGRLWEIRCYLAQGRVCGLLERSRGRARVRVRGPVPDGGGGRS